MAGPPMWLRTVVAAGRMDAVFLAEVQRRLSAGQLSDVDMRYLLSVPGADDAAKALRARLIEVISEHEGKAMTVATLFSPGAGWAAAEFRRDRQVTQTSTLYRARGSAWLGDVKVAGAWVVERSKKLADHWAAVDLLKQISLYLVTGVSLTDAPVEPEPATVSGADQPASARTWEDYEVFHTAVVTSTVPSRALVEHAMLRARSGLLSSTTIAHLLFVSRDPLWDDAKASFVRFLEGEPGAVSAVWNRLCLVICPSVSFRCSPAEPENGTAGFTATATLSTPEGDFTRTATATSKNHARHRARWQLLADVLEVRLALDVDAGPPVIEVDDLAARSALSNSKLITGFAEDVHEVDKGFVCHASCVLTDHLVRASGTGRSKKDAREAAARVLVLRTNAAILGEAVSPAKAPVTSTVRPLRTPEEPASPATSLPVGAGELCARGDDRSREWFAEYLAAGGEVIVDGCAPPWQAVLLCPVESSAEGIVSGSSQWCERWIIEGHEVISERVCRRVDAREVLAVLVGGGDGWSESARLWSTVSRAALGLIGDGIVLPVVLAPLEAGPRAR